VLEVFSKETLINVLFFVLERIKSVECELLSWPRSPAIERFFKQKEKVGGNDER